MYRVIAALLALASCASMAQAQTTPAVTPAPPLTPPRALRLAGTAPPSNRATPPGLPPAPPRAGAAEPRNRGKGAAWKLMIPFAAAARTASDSSRLFPAEKASQISASARRFSGLSNDGMDLVGAVWRKLALRTSHRAAGASAERRHEPF